MALKTDFKDDVLDTSVNTVRKYNMITNDDGTVSLEDATTYLQNGDEFGAQEINATNARVEECFQSVSDGKALLASAITDKRVNTDATATFAQMAANIDAITLGSGNAQKSHVLAPYTFSNDDGVEYTGTMVDNAGKTVTASAVSKDDNYTYLTIPTTAYYSNTSKVKTANSNLRTYKTVTKTFNVTPSGGYLLFDFSDSLTEVVGIVKSYDTNHRVGGVQLIDIQNAVVRLFTGGTTSYSSVPMTVIGY